jgi:branched-chain amino acid transport system substrate-binding protein
VDPSSTSTSVVVPVTVRIGFLGARTGPTAALGRTVENGARLAVSQFTSDRAGVRVVMVDQPTGGTAAGAARAAGQLVADGVVAVIGPQSAPEVRAALPILTAAGIPAVSATATATGLAEAGWTSFFRVVADDQQQGADEAEELVGVLHLDTLAILAGPGAANQTRAAWVSSDATDLGASILFQSSVVTEAAAPVAARAVVGSGVGAVFFSGSDPMAQTLVTALAADGYQGAILVASDSTSAMLGPLGAAADGAYVVSPADDVAAAAANGGQALVFNDAYLAAFGTQPQAWGAEAYDAAGIVLAAVAAGATTGPAVQAYLFNNQSAGVTATIAFDSNGDAVNPPVFVSQVRDGISVQIASTTATSSSGGGS